MPESASDKKGKGKSIVAGIIFLLGGFGALYFGVISINTANNIEKWPIVSGTVTYSKPRMQKTPEGSGSSSFIADVRYAYKVNGALYHNDRISIGQYGSSNRKRIREELRRYPVGREVTVYYDPLNPYDAVLEPGWGWINALPLIIGIGISAFGGFVIRNGIRAH